MGVHLNRVLVVAILGVGLLFAMVVPASALSAKAAAEPTVPRCDPKFATCVDDPDAGCGFVMSCQPKPSVFTPCTGVVLKGTYADYWVCRPS